MTPYPQYVLNGVELNQAQCMAIHVALQSYASQMSKKGALGKDEHGEFMRKAYLQRITEINAIALP